MSEPIRIQKYLSQAGILSRRKAEAAILAGHVLINGLPAVLGQKLDPAVDLITLDPIIDAQKSAYIYLKFHKPRGIVTNCPHPGDTQITDLLPKEYRHLSSVGRLDKESEGLILMTDDGLFSKELIQGDVPHERTYLVSVNMNLNASDLKTLAAGVVILNGYKTKPCQVMALGPRQFKITLTEGKNRQIRRMVETLGLQVMQLKRVSFGRYDLGSLSVGHFELVPRLL